MIALEFFLAFVPHLPYHSLQRRKRLKQKKNRKAFPNDDATTIPATFHFALLPHHFRAGSLRTTTYPPRGASSSNCEEKKNGAGRIDGGKGRNFKGSVERFALFSSQVRRRQRRSVSVSQPPHRGGGGFKIPISNERMTGVHPRPSPQEQGRLTPCSSL